MKFIAALATFVVGISLTSQVHAAKVTKVKGKAVAIKLEGDPAKPGQLFDVYDAKGNRRAVIKIRTVKGDSATAVKGKGIVRAGYTLKERARKRTAKKSAPAKSQREQKSKAASQPVDGRSYWGIVGGLAMDSLSVKVDNDGDQQADTTVDLSGMGFGAKGLFDYMLFDQVWFRGLAGIEGLSSSGSTQVGCGAKACNVNVYYLAFDFWGRYKFSSGNFQPWAGVGFSLMFPLAKDTTALNDKSISNTSVMSIGGGFDWYISPTSFIPIQVEYGMLPESETVTASVIAFRAGLAWPF